jgi:hypothetical protein
MQVNTIPIESPNSPDNVVSEKKILRVASRSSLWWKVVIGTIASKVLGYKFEEAKTESQFEEICQLRYKIYYNAGYIAENPSKSFSDPHDRYSVSFFVKDRIGNMIGAIRLVKYSALSFPAQKYFNIDLTSLGVDPEHMAEPSRLVVDRKYRSRSRIAMFAMGVAIYRYSKEHGIKHWIATLPEKLTVSFARDFGLCFELIREKYPTELHIENRREIGGYFKKSNLKPYIVNAATFKWP